jgi:hypothetical protein
MNSIPRKIVDRLNLGIKKFQPILAAAKSRGDNESDTAKIIIEMLSDVFGYDKFTEIKSEHAVKGGTFCDFAIKLNESEKPNFLIETKAVNIDLKDNHTNQALSYSAREGIEWIVLTNGICWKLYKVIFGQPVDQELVIDFDFCSLTPRKDDCLEMLFQFTREGVARNCLEDYDAHKQALSRFSLAATILTEPALELIRRELRRVSPNAKISVEEIESVLRREVLKGEILEGAKADEARKRIARAQNKASKKSKANDSETVLASCSPIAESETTISVSDQSPTA